MRIEGGQMGEGFLLILEVVVAADEYKPPSSGMTEWAPAVVVASCNS